MDSVYRHSPLNSRWSSPSQSSFYSHCLWTKPTWWTKTPSRGSSGGLSKSHPSESHLSCSSSCSGPTGRSSVTRIFAGSRTGTMCSKTWWASSPAWQTWCSGMDWRCWVWLWSAGRWAWCGWVCTWTKMMISGCYLQAVAGVKREIQILQ